jgi:hypothetical protein
MSNTKTFRLIPLLLLIYGCSSDSFGPVACNVIVEGDRAFIHACTGTRTVYLTKPEASHTVDRHYQFEYALQCDGPWACLRSVRRDAPLFPDDPSDTWVLKSKIARLDPRDPKQWEPIKFRNAALPIARGTFNGVDCVLAVSATRSEMLDNQPDKPARWSLVDAAGKTVEMPGETDLMVLDWHPQQRRIVFAGYTRNPPPSLHIPMAGLPIGSGREIRVPRARPFLVLVWNYDTNTTILNVFNLQGDFDAFNCNGVVPLSPHLAPRTSTKPADFP